jgi:tripartite-type tricarboxylate transporter receptor subunit TctC
MKYRRIVACAVLASVGIGTTCAQDYPSRPLRIVTASPGGGNDFLARIVAPGLEQGLGQNVIVDNRASRLVAPTVKRATPDGYTLAVGGGTMQFIPLLQIDAGYDITTDFAPISQLERSPNVLVVHPSLGVNSVQELVALVKAKPGALRYGTGGSGGSLHVAGEMFMLATGTQMKRIVYKSTGPALLALAGNEVQVVFSTPPGALALVKNGKLKALGVTSAEPFPLIPDLPTLASQGLKGFDLETIGFIVAPLKTPRKIIDVLNRQIVKIMSDPDVAKRLGAGGSVAVTGTPEQLGAKLRAEDARMRKLMKQIGLKPEPA